jgi:hypothetical protein
VTERRAAKRALERASCEDRLGMPRVRTIAIAAIAVVVVTDVTWDGASLHISIGWPGRKPVASFVFP